MPFRIWSAAVIFMIGLYAGRFVEDSRLEEWKTLKNILSPLADIFPNGLRLPGKEYVNFMECFKQTKLEFDYVTCTSLTHGLKLSEISVNRGACDPASWRSILTDNLNTFNFGERFSVNPNPDRFCFIKEVKVVSNRGIQNVSW